MKPGVVSVGKLGLPTPTARGRGVGRPGLAYAYGRGPQASRACLRLRPAAVGRPRLPTPTPRDRRRRQARPAYAYELSIGSDIIVLASAEIAGLPYVISGLIAAGGLAAALSTADGLLLTMANALSHDVYYTLIDPKASTARRVTISKMLLLVVALAAAYVAAQKPADILFLVSAAFSLAASMLFPALTLGIFWKRANASGAILGMLSGLGVTIYYMATTQPWLRGVFNLTGPVELWWGIEPISAGVFGVPVGCAVLILASLMTPPPPVAVQRMVESLRYPRQDT